VRIKVEAGEGDLGVRLHLLPSGAGPEGVGVVWPPLSAATLTIREI
jgi:hypothetical protein